MRNLIKNVLRSFKNNKISIIGLVFLLFFGLGVFCVMSNTTTNIKNEYTSLATKGRLHDFTAAELYEIGNASYAPKDGGIVYSVSSTGAVTSISHVLDLSQQQITTLGLYTGSQMAQEEGTYYVDLPTITCFGQDVSSKFITYISSYHLILDPISSTGLYKKFAESDQTYLIDFNFKVTNTYEKGVDPIDPRLEKLYQAEQTGDFSDLTTLAEDNLLSTDYQEFVKFLNNHTQEILSVMTTTDTPLALELKKSYSHELEYRPFKSINVTATKDNIFYKIIDSNPTDTIDSMVLFSDPAGRQGNRLFDENDWAPYDSQLKIYNHENELIEPGHSFSTPQGSFIIPRNFNDVATTPLFKLSDVRNWDTEDLRDAKVAYAQILQVRFKRMLAADISTTALDDTLKILAAVDLSRQDYLLELLEVNSNLYNAYTSYWTNWYTGAGESITISSNGNVVFGWVELLGTPQTCTISNWTSHFSIVNPQHLEKNNKRVLDPYLLNSFEPFRQWYKSIHHSYPYGEINQKDAIKWFNTLNQEQFSFWLDPTAKEEWNSMEYIIPSLEEPVVVERKNWNGINKKYIADCGGYNQIIWGCGLTPDFMYPVVDISRPTPNTKTECLVYCNESGYSTIKLAFVNSSTEEYLLARFKPNVNTNRRQEILKEINTWAQTNMIFPEDIRCAYFADDTNNILNSSGFRVAYLPRLVNVVELVSTILCSFIGMLCLVICFVIIKRYVERNRVNIGIMRANGIKKWRIAISLLPFALIPAIIGGISAYLVGLGLQAGALSLFSNYWMLPTPLIKFNWISLLACVFIPFTIFSVICWITTLIVLRVNSVELMKPGSEFKTNSFSRIAKKPFKHFGVLTRFRVSLAFNSISRLLMLAAMSCLTMSSLVFAMTTFDKLNKSRELNSTQFDYSFNIELTTPTTNGSVYSTYDYSKIKERAPDEITGFGWVDPTQYIFNTSWDTTNTDFSLQDWYLTDKEDTYRELTKPYSINVVADLEPASYINIIGQRGNLMLPNVSDSDGQNEDLLYLQNKVCSRLTLDYSMGVPGLASSNPWEIALALMPANSRNIAADSFNNIVNYVGHKVSDAKKLYIQKLDELEVPHYDSGVVDDYGQTYKDKIEQALNFAGKWAYSYYYSSLTSGYWTYPFPGFFSYNQDTDTYSLITDITVVGELFTHFNPGFLKLLMTIYSDPELTMMEYPIAYGNIPLNWNVKPNGKKDETYTYVNGNIIDLSNKREFDSTQTIKIEGITKDSQYIKLTDKQNHNLNDYLFDTNYLDSLKLKNNEYPIIINAYSAHRYKLKVGDSITINITNSADRFEQKLHPKSYPQDYNNRTFKVIAISQGTNGEAFYTTQYVANNILGLPNGESWNKTHKFMMWSTPYIDSFGNITWYDWDVVPPKLADLAGVNAPQGKIAKYSFDVDTVTGIPQVDYETPVLTNEEIVPPVGFNGIYTENTTGKPITAGVSLYSYTGMYPGISVYTSNGSNNKFAQILHYSYNLSIANLMSGVENPKYYKANADYIAGRIDKTAFDQYINDFIDNGLGGIYGDTTMVTAICGGMDVAASDLIYSNLISTFNLAETSIMAIIIPITIIIVAIISNLIITDSKRMAAMLKALGYSDSKNLMSILALFVPTIVFGLLLAIPLSFGLTLGYQAIIFNTANILVDVTQKWWFYVAAIGGIGIILIATYAVGFVSLKRDRLVDQIK